MVPDAQWELGLVQSFVRFKIRWMRLYLIMPLGLHRPPGYHPRFARAARTLVEEIEEMAAPRPQRENSEREWHDVSSNAAVSSTEAGCSGAELSTTDDADARAMHAIATLSQQLHRAATCTGPPGLALHVHVALQATADLLVSGQLCAKSSGRVRLACQAWLEWVLIDTSSHRRHGLGHHSEPLALSWQRSERYVRFASESTAHISRSAGPFLVAALQPRAGTASAGSSGPCVLTHGSSASVTALQSQHA